MAVDEAYQSFDQVSWCPRSNSDSSCGPTSTTNEYAGGARSTFREAYRWCLISLFCCHVLLMSKRKLHETVVVTNFRVLVHAFIHLPSSFQQYCNPPGNKKNQTMLSQIHAWIAWQKRTVPSKVGTTKTTTRRRRRRSQLPPTHTDDVLLEIHLYQERLRWIQSQRNKDGRGDKDGDDDDDEESLLEAFVLDDVLPRLFEALAASGSLGGEQGEGVWLWVWVWVCEICQRPWMGSLPQNPWRQPWSGSRCVSPHPRPVTFPSSHCRPALGSPLCRLIDAPPFRLPTAASPFHLGPGYGGAPQDLVLGR